MVYLDLTFFFFFFLNQSYSGLTPTENLVLTGKALILKPTSTSHRRVLALLHHPDAHTQAYNPCIHLFHVSARPAIGLEISAHLLLWLLEKRTHKDKASHAILGRAVQSESVAQRWLVHRMRKLLWNPFKQRGSNFWKSWRELKNFLSVPAIVLYHVGELDNELALLVLLTHFKCAFLQKNKQKNYTVQRVISWFILFHNVWYKNRDIKGDHVLLSKYKKCYLNYWCLNQCILDFLNAMED